MRVVKRFIAFEIGRSLRSLNLIRSSSLASWRILSASLELSSEVAKNSLPREVDDLACGRICWGDVLLRKSRPRYGPLPSLSENLKDTPMSAKLFVGNLAFTATENDLQDHFSQAGVVVSVNIIQDRTTGRSRGFAFVEMSNNEEATRAVSMFNQKEFQGRPLTVNEARPKESRPSGPGGGGGRGDGDRPSYRDSDRRRDRR
jgi:cold-inducible RNA-binding protein